MTDKQRAASRANGAKSRGPITEAGKERSAQNAIKHGLCTEMVVLGNESKERFAAHRAAYMDRFRPADQVEIDLVDQMVASSWRLHRIWAMETSALNKEMFRITPELEKEFSKFDEGTRLCTAVESLEKNSGFLANLSRQESRIARIYHHAIQTLLKLRAECPKPPEPPPTDPPTEKMQNEPGTDSTTLNPENYEESDRPEAIKTESGKPEITALNETVVQESRVNPWPIS